MDRSHTKPHATGSLKFALAVGALCVIAGIGPSHAQVPAEGRNNPLRGPIDLGLTDPALVGAIDIHLHLDPDSPGPGGTIRILDPFDAAAIAKSRGMRGFVFNRTSIQRVPSDHTWCASVNRLPLKFSAACR